MSFPQILLLEVVSIHHRMVLAGQTASTWLLKKHLFSDNIAWDIFVLSSIIGIYNRYKSNLY